MRKAVGMTRVRLFVCLSCVLVLLVRPEISFARGIEAITRPSQDVTLSFVRPGRIARVLANEGEMVKAGQILIQLDDAAEQAQLIQLQAQAENILRIKAAEAQLQLKEVDLKHIESAAKEEAASELELGRARLDVTIAKLSLALARFEHDQYQRKFHEATIRVSRMRLASPIAGRVEKILFEPGESVDELEKVVRVVRIDPLWIEVPVPLVQARGLSLGQSALVDFPTGETVTGRIIHVAAVADAASKTLTVRVVAPNREDRPAGEHVTVSFSTELKGPRKGRKRPEQAHSTYQFPSSQIYSILRSYLWQMRKM